MAKGINDLSAVADKHVLVFDADILIKRAQHPDNLKAIGALRRAHRSVHAHTARIENEWRRSVCWDVGRRLQEPLTIVRSSFG
jgi:hypothetical protein